MVEREIFIVKNVSTKIVAKLFIHLYAKYYYFSYRWLQCNNTFKNKNVGFPTFLYAIISTFLFYILQLFITLNKNIESQIK